MRYVDLVTLTFDLLYVQVLWYTYGVHNYYCYTKERDSFFGNLHTEEKNAIFHVYKSTSFKLMTLKDLPEQS